MGRETCAIANPQIARNSDVTIMLEYISYRLVQLIVSFLPLKFVYCIAGGLARISYYFLHRARRVVRENLRNVFRDWTETELSECVRCNFIQFAKCVADFFYTSKLDSQNINKFVKIENKEYLDESFAKKTGIIAPSGHFGTWELGLVTVALLGRPTSAIVLSHEHDPVDAIFVGQRESKGVKVLPLGKAGRAMRALLRGEVVALLADRGVASQGIKMPFFGKVAVFPRGLPALAVRTGANILPCFMIRQKDDTHKFFFEKAFCADLSKDTGESEKEVLARWIEIFEKYIMLYPEQWFMYYRVWDE